jgi:hypothetical protein
MELLISPRKGDDTQFAGTAHIQVFMEDAGQWLIFPPAFGRPSSIQKTYPTSQKAAPIVKQFTAQLQNEAISMLN